MNSKRFLIKLENTLPPTILVAEPCFEVSSKTFHYFLLSLILDEDQKQVGSFCCTNLKFLLLLKEQTWWILVLLFLSVTLLMRGMRVECRVEEVCQEFLLSFQLPFPVGCDLSAILEYDINAKHKIILVEIIKS